MIETERQRQAALSWIRYWNESVSAGEQSWLGQEQALETIMALRQQIDAYETGVHVVAPGPKPDDVQALPGMAQGTPKKLFVVPSELQNITSPEATLSAGAENGHAAPTQPLELTANTSSR